jgi:hypothetical protein
MIDRLRARQSEIEEAIFVRVRLISGSVGSDDATYQVGLRAATAAIVDYCLTGIEQGEEWSGPIPSVAITQVRRAARNGVSLGTVLLRYFAGHRLLEKFIMEGTEQNSLSSSEPVLRRLRSTQESLLEHLMAAITSEYEQERERMARSAEQRRRELVQRMLVGEPVDIGELDYKFDAWHLGMIATGAKAEKAVRGLADRLGCQLLSVSCGDGSVWAWLGGERTLPIADVERVLSANDAPGVSLVIGEQGRGIDGWRLSHWLAQAALFVALHRPQRFTRCADVPLEAAMLRHEALAALLIRIYLSPLDNLRMGGQVARETLRSYFTCGRNMSSTAHDLRVVRNTVENRLREIEKCLGRTLPTCMAELEVALRLESLKGAADVGKRQPT